MEERYYHFWLSKVKMEARLRKELKGDSGRIAREFEQDGRGLDRSMIKKSLERCRELAIGILLPGDVLYEEAFGELTRSGIHVPYILYMKGNPELLKRPGVAFVGSRTAGDYGRLVTRELVGALAGSDKVIISGGARGIDSIAHETALAVGLPTICVLGCGIGHVYPPENRQLFQQISQRGLLLSEYGPMTPPRPYFFPERNRIIAQLSDQVVVTAAAARSGSLLTAEYALDCNREVFTVPYGIFDEQGEGCNFLLETGARIITKSDSFLELIS